MGTSPTTTTTTVFRKDDDDEREREEDGLEGVRRRSCPPRKSDQGQAVRRTRGNDVTSKSWLKSHGIGDHSLTQGLKGDPTYLVVTDENKIETFGINAVCTHLGCVVPWNVPEKKFKCPCHGSQYDKNGRVIRGPAPLSLALAHAEVDGDDKVIFTPWTETDFRTGLQPWWK